MSNTIKYILFSILVTCIFFICIELLTRIFVSESFLKEKYIEFQGIEFEYAKERNGGFVQDDDLLWKLHPKGYQINHRGFRGAEFKVEKNKDTYRIVVLGDSISFGLGVDLHQTFPYLLQTYLSERTKNHQSKVEIINAAVPGYSSYQLVLLTEQLMSHYSPDFMIIVPGFHNDFVSTAGPGDKHFFGSRKSNWLKSCLRKTNSYIVLRNLIVTLKSCHDAKDSQNRLRVTPDEYYGNLKQIISLCNKKGIGIVIVKPFYSKIRQIEAPSCLKYSHKTISVCKELSVPSIEIDKQVEAFSPSDLYLHDLIHLNPLGHFLMAQEIAHYFRAHHKETLRVKDYYEYYPNRESVKIISCNSNLEFNELNDIVHLDRGWFSSDSTKTGQIRAIDKNARLMFHLNSKQDFELELFCKISRNVSNSIKILFNDYLIFDKKDVSIDLWENYKVEIKSKWVREGLNMLSLCFGEESEYELNPSPIFVLDRIESTISCNVNADNDPEMSDKNRIIIKQGTSIVVPVFAHSDSAVFSFDYSVKDCGSSDSFFVDVFLNETFSKRVQLPSGSDKEYKTNIIMNNIKNKKIVYVISYIENERSIVSIANMRMKFGKIF